MQVSILMLYSKERTAGKDSNTSKDGIAVKESNAS